MDEITLLQDKIEELMKIIEEKDAKIGELDSAIETHIKTIDDFNIRVNELEETNNLKSKKISDLILNSSFGQNDSKQENIKQEEKVIPLEELIGGM